MCDELQHGSNLQHIEKLTNWCQNGVDQMQNFKGFPADVSELIDDHHNSSYAHFKFSANVRNYANCGLRSIARA